MILIKNESDFLFWTALSFGLIVLAAKICKICVVSVQIFLV